MTGERAACAGRADSLAPVREGPVEAASVSPMTIFEDRR